MGRIRRNAPPLPFAKVEPINSRLGEFAWNVFTYRTASVEFDPKYESLRFSDRLTGRWLATLGPYGFSERASGTWVTIRRLKQTDIDALKRTWTTWRVFLDQPA